DASRDLARRTVQEMHTLVQHLDDWTERDAEMTRAVSEMWDSPANSNADVTAAAAVVPIESLFYDDEGPHIIEPEPSADATTPMPTVRIEDLLYRGPDALQAAL